VFKAGQLLSRIEDKSKLRHVNAAQVIKMSMSSILCTDSGRPNCVIHPAACVPCESCQGACRLTDGDGLLYVETTDAIRMPCHASTELGLLVRGKLSYR